MKPREQELIFEYLWRVRVVTFKSRVGDWERGGATSQQREEVGEEEAAS